jgi:hypothetical protein
MKIPAVNIGICKAGRTETIFHLFSGRAKTFIMFGSGLTNHRISAQQKAQNDITNAKKTVHHDYETEIYIYASIIKQIANQLPKKNIWL